MNQTSCSRNFPANSRHTSSHTLYYFLTLQFTTLVLQPSFLLTALNSSIIFHISRSVLFFFSSWRWRRGFTDNLAGWPLLGSRKRKRDLFLGRIVKRMKCRYNVLMKYTLCVYFCVYITISGLLCSTQRNLCFPFNQSS